ncbi:hypothetical protein KHA80_05355 [Anaerobacillus sp. HL2]|nr:hypothetical protein KHA80_05355 [Anaerobacillus sp. HL2]
MNYINLTKQKERNPEDILSFIHDGDDIIVPIANGEPTVLLDTLEQNAMRFNGVHVHQMYALRERDYIWGKFKGHIEHVDYFFKCYEKSIFGRKM